jgi:hypothetical protein
LIDQASQSEIEIQYIHGAGELTIPEEAMMSDQSHSHFSTCRLPTGGNELRTDSVRPFLLDMDRREIVQLADE